MKNIHRLSEKYPLYNEELLSWLSHLLPIFAGSQLYRQN
ncbi:hypothetical protein AB2I57_25325 (plasmid) [Escherichia coli]